MPQLRAILTVPSNKRDLDAALEGLVRINVALLQQYAQAGRPVPPLLRAGVHWQPDELRGKPAETWDNLDVVRRRGYGDCEDLASWAAAELRFTKGIAARAIVRPSSTPGVAWHCIVELPNGQTIDPSLKLGMREYRAAHPKAHHGPLGADLVRAVDALARKTAQWRASVRRAKGLPS